MSSTRSPAGQRWMAACRSSRAAVRMLHLALVDFTFLVAVNAALVGISTAASSLEFEMMRGKKRLFSSFKFYRSLILEDVVEF
jgi:hypothetical protein